MTSKRFTSNSTSSLPFSGGTRTAGRSRPGLDGRVHQRDERQDRRELLDAAGVRGVDHGGGDLAGQLARLLGRVRRKRVVLERDVLGQHVHPPRPREVGDRADCRHRASPRRRSGDTPIIGEKSRTRSGLRQLRVDQRVQRVLDRERAAVGIASEDEGPSAGRLRARAGRPAERPRASPARPPSSARPAPCRGPASGEHSA